MIETFHLTKNYGRFRAVTDVNLKVKEGEVFGFLGLNGAGKTTLMRMLTGLLRPPTSAFHLGCRTRPWDSIWPGFRCWAG